MNHFRRRAVGVAGAAIAVGALAMACTPDEVTRAPSSSVAESPRLAAGAAELSVVRASLEDARSRMAPSVERLVADAELTDRLRAVEQAIRAEDGRALERAVGRAEQTLARLRVLASPAATADLDAISFALADARRLLTSPTQAAAAAERRSIPTETTKP